MALDPQLLELLACPDDKGPLLYFADEDSLYNPRLKRRYAIRDDIPVMLVDEAETVDDTEHARLLAKAEADGIEPTFDPERMTADAPERLDSLGLFDATAGLPEQIEVAVAAAHEVVGLPEHDDIENVVVLGMGGSGIAGDVVPVVAGPFMAVPVVVHKGYGIPNFIDDHTLVFAVSFSGDTEETVEGAIEAAAAGGRVVAVARGGELGRLADAWGTPRVRVADGLPVPRSAIGALAVPPLVLLERMGMFPGASSWIAAAVDQLRIRRDQLVVDDNPAERLARRIGRLMPIVYGGGGVGSVAAHRWKTQFNENAKVPAFVNTMPELCHNEICGWGQNGDVTRQVFRVVNLRHEFEHPQISRRFDLVNGVIDEVVAGIDEVVAEGDGPLAQLLDLALFGDFVSLHRAAQEGLDPGPVPVLDDLKAALASD